MKMKLEHYNYLFEQIKKVENKETFKNDCLLSPMRYRWDLLYAAKLSTWICNNLYSYLNDDHIDTALRKITKT